MAAFVKGQCVTFTPVTGHAAGQQLVGKIIVPREVHGRAPYAVLATTVRGLGAMQVLVPHALLHATCSGCHRTHERTGERRVCKIKLGKDGECRACREGRAEFAAAKAEAKGGK